jgi:hypothetical protein
MEIRLNKTTTTMMRTKKKGEMERMKLMMTKAMKIPDEMNGDQQPQTPSETNDKDAIHKEMTIMQWNINGYYAQFENLKLLLKENNPAEQPHACKRQI